jgi:hypothetical protein
MGKRSQSFERIPRDLYPTPSKAVKPLLPYLCRDGIKAFAELCAGNGDLIRHLESFGLQCVHSGDIATGQDALKATAADYNGAQVGITNPPFKYPEDPPRTTRLLRDLIQHFLGLGKPFWLLLPHDFSANKGSASYLRCCSNIVVVGRVKWIPDSDHSGGYENSSWRRFDGNHRGLTAFHNDRGVLVPIMRILPIKDAAE